MFQSILRPIHSPVLRSVWDVSVGGGGSAWTPAALFAGGEQGAWLDESDLSTMFQDLAGTMPAAVDMPVGKRLDKSGNGNHWTAKNTSARPILRLDSGLYSLQWDGVDDCGTTPSIDFTATDKMSVFVGVYRASAAVGIMIENTSYVINTRFSLWLSGFGVGDISGASGISEHRFPPYAYPAKNVIAASYDAAGLTPTAMKLRVDGIARTPITAGNASGSNFGNLPLYIGARNSSSLFLTGRTYGEIVVGKLATAPEIADTEAYLAAKTGVTMP